MAYIAGCKWAVDLKSPRAYGASQNRRSRRRRHDRISGMKSAATSTTSQRVAPRNTREESRMRFLWKGQGKRATRCRRAWLSFDFLAPVQRLKVARDAHPTSQRTLVADAKPAETSVSATAPRHPALPPFEPALRPRTRTAFRWRDRGRTGSFDGLDLDGLRGVRAGFGGGGGRSAVPVCWPNSRSLSTAISSPSVSWLIGRSGPSLGRPATDRCCHSSIRVAAAALEPGSETRRLNFA